MNKIIEEIKGLQKRCEKKEEYQEQSKIGAYWRGKVDGLEEAIWIVRREINKEVKDE